MLLVWMVSASQLVMQCQLEAMMEPLADPAALTNLDVLEGPAPLNVKVMRDTRNGGFVGAQLRSDDETGAPLDLPANQDMFLQTLDAGLLEPRAAYTISMFDRVPQPGDAEAGMPEPLRRDLPFRTGDADDLTSPTVGNVEDAVEEKTAGGPGLGMCGGPVPYWRPDQFAYTVALPETDDDLGVAAVELLATTPDGEFTVDMEIIGTGDNKLIGVVTDQPPERLRVRAIDHAGNKSRAVEVVVRDAGGCAQTGAATPLVGLLALLALRSRGSRRRSR